MMQELSVVSSGLGSPGVARNVSAERSRNEPWRSSTRIIFQTTRGHHRTTRMSQFVSAYRFTSSRITRSGSSIQHRSKPSRLQEDTTGGQRANRAGVARNRGRSVAIEHVWRMVGASGFVFLRRSVGQSVTENTFLEKLRNA